MLKRLETVETGVAARKQAHRILSTPGKYGRQVRSAVLKVNLAATSVEPVARSERLP